MKSGLNGTNGTGGVGMPWSDFSKFDFSKNAFADMAERGVARAQERCDKIKALSADLAEAVSETYASNARGATDYGLKLIEISNANTASAIDFLAHVLGSKSVTDVFSISASEARRAFDTAAARNRELFDLAQRLARETSEPIRKHVANTFQQAS
jgi:phasin